MSHSNGILILQGHAVRRDEACLADGEIWHERVGHASAKHMRILRNRHLIPAVTGNPEHTAHCIGCTKGKQRRALRGQSSVRDHSCCLAPAQRIHCDIAFPGTSVTGECAILTTVDECGRMCFAWPLHNKAHMAPMLIKFMHELKTQGRPVANLRSDNDGVFEGIEFKAQLEALGISCGRSPPVQPTSNGLIERFHHTLSGIMRATLHHRGIDIRLWPYFITLVCYLLNRLPHSGIQDAIPYGHGLIAHL